MSKTTNEYSPQVRERAVRLVLDNQGQHESRWSAILSISSKIGCAPQRLNEWVKKAEVAEKSEPLSAIAPRTMASVLERKNRELKQANEILRKASAYFAPLSGPCSARPFRATGRSSTAGPGHDRLYRRE